MKLLFIEYYYLFLTGYFVAITAVLFIAVYIFYYKWTRKSQKRTVIINLLVSLFPILYILLMLEGIFAYFFIQPDGLGFTLASERWIHKYWNPINSYDYRGYEPEWKDKIVFVVGDSFVAGHGIEKIDNRFSNILSNRLGNTWTVAALADCGWQPIDYIKALETHNKTPDVIVISYYLNDIQRAGVKNGIKRPKLTPHKPNSPFIEYSYLLNWAYWRMYRKGYLGAKANKHWKYFKRLYRNNDVWNTHLQELDALINYADRVDARIGFVIWPNLIDVSGSKDITYRLSDYLSGKGIIAIDLSKLFEKRNSNELVVNSMDAHPNEVIHAEVAQLLYRVLAPWD